MSAAKKIVPINAWVRSLPEPLAGLAYRLLRENTSRSTNAVDSAIAQGLTELERDERLREQATRFGLEVMVAFAAEARNADILDALGWGESSDDNP